MEIYNGLTNFFGVLNHKNYLSESKSDIPLENTSNSSANNLIGKAFEKYNAVANSIQGVVHCAFSTIKHCSYKLKKTTCKCSALWERNKKGSQSNIVHKERQLKKEEETNIDSIVENIPRLFQLEEQHALRKERQLKKEKIDDSILIDTGKFFKQEEQKIERKNAPFYTWGNIWNKDNKIVKIIDTIRTVAYSIFSQIRIYSFHLKNKVLNLFKEEVTFKAFHHDLKEIVNKGLALRELNKEGSDSNILHKERELKKEETTDFDSVLKDIPRLFKREEHKIYTLLKGKKTIKNSACSSISFGITTSIQNMAYSIFSKINKYSEALKNSLCKSFSFEGVRKQTSTFNTPLKDLEPEYNVLEDIPKLFQREEQHLLRKERELKKEQYKNIDVENSILQDIPGLFKEEERKMQLKSSSSSSNCHKTLGQSSLERYPKVLETIQNVGHFLISPFRTIFPFNR